MEIISNAPCVHTFFSCPSGRDCSWVGTIGQMPDHIKKDHRLISKLSGDDIIFIAEDVNVPHSMNWLVMVFSFDSYFLGRLNKIYNPMANDAEFSISFDLIGPSENAREFAYTLEIRGQGKRRLAWEAPMKSLLERVQESINDPPVLKFRRETLVFNDKQMNLLKSECGRLYINISVKKTPPTPPPSPESDAEYEYEVKRKSSQETSEPGQEKKSKAYDGNDFDDDVFEEKDFYAYLNKYARNK